jgi:hypothetical protein
MPLVYAIWSAMALLLLVGVWRTPSANGLVLSVAFCAALPAHAWWIYVRLPYQIETDEREIRFIGRTGCVAVRWSQLRSVTWPRTQGARLDWEWDGGRLYTIGPIDEERGLFTVIEQRAPSATIERRWLVP